MEGIKASDCQNNHIIISLLRFGVLIKIRPIDNKIVFSQCIYDNGRKVLQLEFYSLEDVLRFTEDTVSYCKTSDEILDCYREQYVKNKVLKKI